MSDEGAPGLLASARAAVSTLIEILRTRLQLLGVDLEEQGQRLIQSLVLALVAAVLFVLGIACTGMLLTLWLWSIHPALAVGCVFVLLFGGAAVAAWLCVRRFKAGPRPFEASLEELDKDLGGLRGKA